MRAVPRTLRLMNQRTVLERLFREGPTTRAALAEATGMSRPTSGLIIDELLAARVLEEGALANDGRPGRPGRSVMLERKTPRFLLIQIGVKHTDLAAVAVGGIANPREERFNTPTSERAFLSELEAAVRRLELRPRTLWAFAVSLPGLLDEATGRVMLSPNMHWTESPDFASAMSNAVDLPGCFVQEHRAMALGHIAATDDRDFLLVDVEDGVGGALVLERQVFHSSSPTAGEIGHTAVLGNRRPCGCGGRGCLETLMARPALVSAFASASRQSSADWSDLVASLTARPAVPRWLVSRLEAAAIVIGGALNTSGLGRVLLVGALAELPSSVISLLAAKICEASLSGRLGRVTVECAPRRRTLGLLQAVFSRLLVPTSDWSRPCMMEREILGRRAV